VSFREDVFTDLQNDLCCPLLADAYFADINVIDYRKQNILQEVELSLSSLKSKVGKIGVCVVALPVVITDTFKEGTPFHPLQCHVTYRVLENPLINMGARGTKKPAPSICSRIRRILKAYRLGGFATNLVPADPFVDWVQVDEAPVAFEINFTCFEHVDQNEAKCASLGYYYNSVTGVLQLSCSTPDATIYYTLDGGYPHPNNPNGFTILTYTGPITIEGEVLVRAAAFKVGYLPGDVWASRFNMIGDGMGGLLGEEGGGAITQS